MNVVQLRLDSLTRGVLKFVDLKVADLSVCWLHISPAIAVPPISFAATYCGQH